jgi:RNA polymerase subunit RPABC4/transcription elongation factor Spt4
MSEFDAAQINNLLTVLALYVVVALFAFWAATAFWAYRDMHARTRDGLATLFAAAVVLLLPAAGLLVYLMLRPRETLAEAYERSLEEEALLQEIEEKPTCPGCGQRTQANWQVCPHCHTRLKKACYNCGQMLELSWNMCPHCAAPQVDYTSTASTTDYAPTRADTDRRARRRRASESPTVNDSLQFVEGEDS